MKKNLEILDFENKLTKANKPYVRFKTSDGWMSCFDVKTCETLKSFEGKTASVEVIESGEFKNIKKCYGPSGDEDLAEVKPEVPGKVTERSSAGRNATMYTSYAKDIFCGLLQKVGVSELKNTQVIMEDSITLVKQARTAFE